MIRRIQITNDLLDVIKSCPSGVIDDIYKIEYYIQGFDTVYEAEFTHEGDCLKVVLPSSELEKLESGILMRRAYYKVSDSSYPDGYYNLTFEDNMNVWLGGESSDPYERQYVTEKDLNKTLEDYALKTEVPSLDGYATESWVESKGYLTSTGMSGLATQSWVSSNFLSTTSLNGYATESWVESKGYLTSTGMSGLATQSWVSSNFLSTTALNGYATESWVNNQGYITSIPDTFATKDWVSTQGYLTEHQDLTGYATQSWVNEQGYVTAETLPEGIATESWVQSWVNSQGYLTSTGLSGLATQSWVSSQQFATESWVSNQGYITSVPDTFATKTWVSAQGYLTEHQDLSSYALKSEIPSLTGYATQSWVTSQGYITSTGLSGLATQSWVSSNFLSTKALSGYATQTWVTSQGYTTQTYVDDKIGQIDTLLDQMLG